jgi:hypothetical protein
VAEHGDLPDAEVVKQGRGVRGQQLEAVVDIGLGRLAPADLVRRHHPVPGPGQRLDDVLEVVAAERLAMEQHDRLTIGRRGWRNVQNVHVRHRDRL